ncbi:hypothetical protein F5878DRAFT_647863 [Lentinula raphanica]|uniref:Uncharacterized protein n=1 Tax=Lentinula raphanica TaxID=153919 RepID=A0AA38U3Y7_9AGAR|nr:hypothetical protein F5878DRAFT_647863 [Lentinula raphanica]
MAIRIIELNSGILLEESAAAHPDVLIDHNIVDDRRLEDWEMVMTQVLIGVLTVRDSRPAQAILRLFEGMDKVKIHNIHIRDGETYEVETVTMKRRLGLLGFVWRRRGLVGISTASRGIVVARTGRGRIAIGKEVVPVLRVSVVTRRGIGGTVIIIGREIIGALRGRAVSRDNGRIVRMGIVVKSGRSGTTTDQIITFLEQFPISVVQGNDDFWVPVRIIFRVQRLEMCDGELVTKVYLHITRCLRREQKIMIHRKMGRYIGR